MTGEEATSRSLWEDLKQRKVVQWGAAYLGGAWVVYEGAELLGQRFGWPPELLRAVPVVLAVGLLGALVLAWYHGEKGRQRVSGVELLMLAGILVLAGSGIALVNADDDDGDPAEGTEAAARPDSDVEAGTGAPGAHVRLESEPEGASVTLTRVEPAEGFAGREPVSTGRTPHEAELPSGEYLIRFELERTNPVRTTRRVRPADTLRLRPRLVPSGELTAGMVRVEAGPSPVDPPPGVADRTSREAGSRVGPFLADHVEVTNAAFRDFVSEGGYEDPSLWPDSLRLEGEWIERREALRRLTGRSGMPGPRGWSAGLYPDGRADRPVTGVTWYEARAYCRWSEKRLPGWTEWWRAAHGDTLRSFPWGDDDTNLSARANFNLEGARPVGSFPLGASPFGLLDMAGNVREWIAANDAGAERQWAVGGSYQDPSYMAEPSQAEAFPPGFANDALGFRCVRRLRR